ncbi:bifunctional serine/threonine-protein kinase/formylglycine-generating enzyme family protein [Haloferula sargassicola]|uniref:Protein kinase domain-containing protein n=1 Tax=Haloferula sargassicola TaxID=490096 RepID=A0ABP9UQH2_9BACT
MPTTRLRPDPVIPDHEVLRRIGGGAYGEVWLARGVTGALRAVKVLWREDFEDDRGFEREFEGILKYEPVSRDHPGLVNVLHVGRGPGEPPFYYYVMELGDDIVAGSDINPIEYEARTLRSDIKNAGRKRLETAFCIDVGQRLAEALQHLHESGLAHRDVKPANVIFVNNRAKLADIGLVAARGQRTFVGTEGFVPPEGPGSAQADVYSLGKVLYEMATGKDRLEFPELPDELPHGPERKEWLELNRIICGICDPHISRRTITSAGDLAKALSDLRAGKRRRRRRPVGAFLFFLLAGAGLMWGGWEIWHRTDIGERLGFVSPPPPPEPAKPAFVKVSSTPEGADVFEIDDSGKAVFLGRTPTELIETRVGKQLSLRMLKDGYRAYPLEAQVPRSAENEPLTITALLSIFSPPVKDMPWKDHLDEEFRPLGEGHESLLPVEPAAWRRFARANDEFRDQGEVLSGVGELPETVAVSPQAARAFCQWYVATGIKAGYLTTEHEAVPRPVGYFDDSILSENNRGKDWKPFRLLVRPIPYGRLIVRTIPPGAVIYVNGASEGEAEDPLVVDRVKPGEVEVRATLEGHKPETQVIQLEAQETEMVSLTLKPNMSAVLTRPWENSLGMQLVPAGKDWMASVWETRWSDFRAYCEATRAPMPPRPEWADELPEGDSLDRHPVILVSRDECQGFCAWLTLKEWGEDRLGPDLEYRLPTDFEWSQLAGVDEPAGASPARRDQMKARIFLWGPNWPPPGVVGNLAGMGAGLPSNRMIPGYDDGFVYTAPVGSFAPTVDHGIFDLVGNVQEWVSDSYSSTTLAMEIGLLRGGGWRSYLEKDLYIGARNPQPPTAKDSTYGFRVVLAKRVVPPARTQEGPLQDG